MDELYIPINQRVDIERNDEEWLRPIQQTMLYEEIIKLIRNQIASGNLKPGDRLPSGRKLSEKLMVSRAVVREAMRILEFMGVAKIQHGGMTILLDRQNRDMLIDSLDTILRPDKDIIMDLIEIRYLIEPSITRLAAERANSKDLEQLKETLEQMKAEIDSGNFGIQGSMNFHYSLARSTRNRVAMRVMNVLIGISWELRALSYRTPGRPRVSLDQHRNILDAMIRKDSLEAEAAMREHFKSLADDISMKCKTKIQRGGYNKYKYMIGKI
ncbi:MAG: FadR family transcriptional regulator [Deltaproteobacteria bacterium]|nr:FadR family transcriptional regulator [Deltaproteobacteria bacterium]